MRGGVPMFHPLLLHDKAAHDDEKDYGPDVHGELHGEPNLVLYALGSDAAPLLMATADARGNGEERELWARGESRRVVGEMTDGGLGGARTDEVPEELLAEEEA